MRTSSAARARRARLLRTSRGRCPRTEVAPAFSYERAAIYNRDQIAIDTVDPQLVHHGFLLDNGRFTEIRPRGVAGNGSLATDVDDRGRVLGYAL